VAVDLFSTGIDGALLFLELELSLLEWLLLVIVHLTVKLYVVLLLHPLALLFLLYLALDLTKLLQLELIRCFLLLSSDLRQGLPLLG